MLCNNELRQPQKIPMMNPCQNIISVILREIIKAVKSPITSHSSGSAFFVKPNTERVPIKIPNKESKRIRCQFMLQLFSGEDKESQAKAGGF